MRPTHPRASRRAAILASLAVGAALVGACGSPSPSLLTDPTQILAGAATAAAEATSVHVDAAVDGAVAIDLMGMGGDGAPIKLTNTTASGDVDLAGGDARVTFAIPAILNLAGELISVDGTTWLKTTMTGPLYRELDTGDLPLDPGAAGDLFDQLAAFLARPEVDPVKGEDVPCGSATCYSVRIELTPEELASLGADPSALPSAIPGGFPIPIDLASASLDLTFLVEQATPRLAGMTAVVGLGESGELTADLTFSKWNEPVSIAAPPVDQVQPGS